MFLGERDYLPNGQSLYYMFIGDLVCQSLWKLWRIVIRVESWIKNGLKINRK
jgi:hypothetical protein